MDQSEYILSCNPASMCVHVDSHRKGVGERGGHVHLSLANVGQISLIPACPTDLFLSA